MTTPAGWYPDSENPGQMRYWDGSQWTEHTAVGQEATPPASTTAATTAATPVAVDKAAKNRATNKRNLKILGAIVGVFLLIGIISAAAGGDKKDDAASVTAPSPKAVETSAAAETSSPTPSAAPVAADPESDFRDAVKDHLGPGDKLTSVTLTKRADGSYDVVGDLDSHEALQAKNAPKAVREAAYHFLFASFKQTKVKVFSATANVSYPLTSATGQTANEKVYEALLSNAVGKQLKVDSWDDYYAINWEAVTVVQYEHPAMQGS